LRVLTSLVLPFPVMLAVALRLHTSPGSPGNQSKISAYHQFQTNPVPQEK
jgi:hypothetical protein